MHPVPFVQNSPLPKGEIESLLFASAAWLTLLEEGEREPLSTPGRSAASGKHCAPSAGLFIYYIHRSVMTFSFMLNSTRVAPRSDWQFFLGGRSPKKKILLSVTFLVNTSIALHVTLYIQNNVYKEQKMVCFPIH